MACHDKRVFIREGSLLPKGGEKEQLKGVSNYGIELVAILVVQPSSMRNKEMTSRCRTLTEKHTAIRLPAMANGPFQLPLLSTLTPGEGHLRGLCIQVFFL